MANIKKFYLRQALIRIFWSWNSMQTDSFWPRANQLFSLSRVIYLFFFLKSASAEVFYYSFFSRAPPRSTSRRLHISNSRSTSVFFFTPTIRSLVHLTAFRFCSTLAYTCAYTLAVVRAQDSLKENKICLLCRQRCFIWTFVDWTGRWYLFSDNLRKGNEPILLR